MISLQISDHYRSWLSIPKFLSLKDYPVFLGDEPISMAIRAKCHFFSHNGLTTPANFIIFRVANNLVRSARTLIERFIGRVILHCRAKHTPPPPPIQVTQSNNSTAGNIEYSANLHHPKPIMTHGKFQRTTIITLFLTINVLSVCWLAISSAQDAATAPGRSAAGLGRFEKTLSGEREIRSRLETFFKDIETGKTGKAFSALMKGSPLGENTESVDKLVAETKDIVETYGTIKDHELIRINRVGSRIIRFTYFTYSDNYPLKWELYCFLGKSGWQILDFSVNNKFTELFDAEMPKLPARPENPVVSPSR